MNDDCLSDEDKALFQENMKGVTPLKKDKPKLGRPATVSPAPPKKKRTIPPDETPQYYLSDFIRDEVQSESILSFCPPGLANKQFRALKNGAIRWEACLDLHGLNTDAARKALIDFINQHAETRRCLLIIHGKGGHQGGTPVIKNLVNRWLMQLTEVLAFHSAKPKDGGTGAVYVLLKKVKHTSF